MSLVSHLSPVTRRAFTLIAVGLAQDVSWIALLLGMGALAGSIVIFRKCKPWEHRES